MKSKRVCLIDGCENEIGPRRKSDICTTCQQGLRYWDKKSWVEIEERQRKLGMYQARMGRIRVTGAKRTTALARQRSASAAQHARH